MADWESETLASAEAAEDLFGEWAMSSPTEERARQESIAPPMSPAPSVAPPVPAQSQHTVSPLMPVGAEVPEPADPSVAVSRPLRGEDDEPQDTEALVASLFVTDTPAPEPLTPTTPTPSASTPTSPPPPEPAFVGAGAPMPVDHRSPIDWTGQGGRVDERVTSSDDILRVSEATALPAAGRDRRQRARPPARPRSRPASATTTDRRRGHSLRGRGSPRSHRRRPGGRCRPGGLGSGHHAGALGPRRDRRRQGHLPARQDLRRRPHHRRAARARRASGSTRPTSPRGSTSTTSWSAPRRAARSRFPLPRDGGRYGAVARRRDLDAALVEVARAAGATVRRGRDAARRRPGRRRRRRPRSTGSARCGPGGPSAPTACGRRCARRSASPTRPTAASGTPSASTSSTCRPRRRASCVVWFEPDLLPGYAWSFPHRRRRGQRRVRHPPRHQLQGGRHGRRSGVSCWPDPTSAPFLGPDARRRVAPPGLAHPGPGRPGRAERRAHPLRGRRRRRHRPDDRRGHRPGARHRRAGPPRRSSPSPATPSPPAPPTSTRCAATWPSTTASPSSSAGVLSSPLGARAAVRVAGLTDWTRRNFARWLFEDYPRALLLTPGRWHRGMFTGPGAYR